MSILSVANVHFESTGANRIDYPVGGNEFRIRSSSNISIIGLNINLTADNHTTGNVLSYNGNTWVSQVPPTGLPNSGASGNVLVSNGSSWISQSPAPSGIVITNETASLSTYYPALTTVTSGTILTANTSSTKLYFTPSTGTLAATIFNSLSDEKHKTDIQTIDNPLEMTEQLRGVWFKWADTGAPSMGLIAQEVEKVLPQIVSENEGIKTLNYDALIGLLIEDIKALKTKIEKLENNA